MRRKYAVLAFLPLLLLSSTVARSQEPAAPTASGFPSEGAEDLSAATSQSGSMHQTDWNLLSTLQNAELLNEEGEQLGQLSDVLLDEAGRIQGLLIEEGGIVGLGETRRIFETAELPAHDSEGLVLSLSQEQAQTLGEFEASPGLGSWLASTLLGTEMSSASRTVEITDLRFTSDRVDRIVLRDTEGVFSQAQELPFSGIAVSGDATEPEVALTEEGRQRLDAIVEVE